MAIPTQRKARSKVVATTRMRSPRSLAVLKVASPVVPRMERLLRLSTSRSRRRQRQESQALDRSSTRLLRKPRTALQVAIRTHQVVHTICLRVLHRLSSTMVMASPRRAVHQRRRRAHCPRNLRRAPSWP